MKTNYLLLFAACILAVSCGSSKKSRVSQDTEVIVPCSGLEFTTSAEYFRASAMGSSTSMEIASQKAMTSARAKLAAALETTVKTVTDNFLSSYEDGTNESARSRFQSMTREVVSQKLSGIRVICQKTMKTSEGQFNAYVAVELAGKEITEAITKSISDDSKLRTDYEYQKFLETFEKEMKSLAEAEKK